MRAKGIATMPTLKNSHAVISTFSRRSAISQRIVAREPVTDRFGPEIDADQNRVGDNSGFRGVPDRGTAHKAHRQVVHSIREKSHYQRPCQLGRLGGSMCKCQQSREP